MLEFSISNQTLTRLDGTQVVSDSDHYLECAFQFSEDWKGVIPIATFGHRDVEKPISVPVVNGVCQVPHEVIHPHGFYLALYGTGRVDGEVFSHIPTDTAAVEVTQSGQAEGLSVPEPTQSLFDYLMEQIQKSEQAAVEAKTSASASASMATEAAERLKNAAARAETSARESQQNAGTAVLNAQAAQRTAAAAQQQLAQLQEDLQKVSDYRINLEDYAMLCQSYAVGTAKHDILYSCKETIPKLGGTLRGEAIGLAPNRRYVAKLNGAYYEGICRLVDDPDVGPEDVEEEEREPEKPWPWPWEPEDPNKEVMAPETPVMPGGDEEQAELPGVVTPVKYQAELVLGPVILRDQYYGTMENAHSVVVNNSSADLYSVLLMTDGQENARYYMEQAKLAMNECKSVLAKVKRYAEEALG